MELRRSLGAEIDLSLTIGAIAGIHMWEGGKRGGPRVVAWGSSAVGCGEREAGGEREWEVPYAEKRVTRKQPAVHGIWQRLIIQQELGRGTSGWTRKRALLALIFQVLVGDGEPRGPIMSQHVKQLLEGRCLGAIVE